MGTVTACESLCAAVEPDEGNVGGFEVMGEGTGEGASGSGANMGESSLFLELLLAALCENCGIVTTLLASLLVCSGCVWGVGIGVAASPEASAIDVCMHLRNGLLCITTLCLRLRLNG